MAQASTLQSLLFQQGVDQAPHHVSLSSGVSAGLMDGEGGVRFETGSSPVFPLLGYGHPLQSGYAGYRAVEVPILAVPTEQDLERAIALGLITAAGGRRTTLSSWQHLPQHWSDLFDGYTRPKMLITHPYTIHALLAAFLSVDPNRAFLTPPTTIAGHAAFMGAELFPCPHLPEGTVVLAADGHELGRMFTRDPGGPPVRGEMIWGNSPTPLGRTAPRLNPMRVGILLNASALSVVTLLVPPPPPKTAWTRVLSDDLFED